MLVCLKCNHFCWSLPYPPWFTALCARGAASVRLRYYSWDLFDLLVLDVHIRSLVRLWRLFTGGSLRFLCAFFGLIVLEVLMVNCAFVCSMRPARFLLLWSLVPYEKSEQLQT